MATKGEGPPTLVIAIDFGTTYSGVAWKVSSKLGESIQTVTDWPTARNYHRDTAKAPSSIFYPPSDDEDPTWGYTTPLKEGVLRWFKLLLVNEKDLPANVRTNSQVKEARELMHKLGKTPVQIFGDYLRQVWKHSFPQISRAEGERCTDIYRVHFVITLPAIWPHYVRIRMVEAMKIAGLFDVTKEGNTTYGFISEPEAAALTCLKENAGRYKLNVGDHFVICDAGGGTVDIITYKIEKLNPFTVSESVKGDGGLCGGIFLDEKFRGLLKRTIPREIVRNLELQAIHKIMKHDWEAGIKASLCKDSTAYSMDLLYKGNVDKQFFPDSFTIQAKAIREEVYEPVVKEIKALVATQIRQVEEEYQKSPNFIFLVGGFGRSKYLYECLKDTFGKKSDILQKRGENPWAAVLRGAVLHGLSRTGLNDSITAVVTSRISRHNYGTVFNDCPFDANKHDIRDREYCIYDKAYIAVDQTEWYVGIGDPVSTYAPVSFSCYQALLSVEQGLQIDIVISDSAEPPNRKDQSVRTLCTITAPLDYEIWAKLPKNISEDGKTFRCINYDLRMISDGSCLEFAVWYKNQCIASQNVDFETTKTEPKEKDQVDTDVPMEDPPEVFSDAPTVINIADSDDEYVDRTPKRRRGGNSRRERSMTLRKK
ncbi:uncharacterized protein FIESC28_07419 [Fusarium coffeatum]|uniref:Actin-like ATPase domain-containing protein n=1 Tax=Fusarium coffeatum TaxID=231269 RepID=A0A366RD93_9HYPO|nr:uncharacterized protein FIESC28_07419 [Fusarium coffeatum]RBR15103.1 hypothetical protein FIESC28_07419 [Fusarium coffeatum]